MVLHKVLHNTNTAKKQPPNLFQFLNAPQKSRRLPYNISKCPLPKKTSLHHHPPQIIKHPTISTPQISTNQKKGIQFSSTSPHAPPHEPMPPCPVEFSLAWEKLFPFEGTISFDELDRKAAASLEKFRVMSLMHHPSIEDMWKAKDFLLELLGI